MTIERLSVSPKLLSGKITFKLGKITLERNGRIYVLRCKAESDCCIMVADSFRGGMANGGFNKIL